MLLLDHLAVSAETLDAGQEAVETALGVALQPGGRHGHFGTHNRLLGLEDGLYLEVIAIDPGASGATRPRWFDLDRFAGAPRLTNWICRTKDLADEIAAFPEAGTPVALARGGLRWRMAVPGNVILPFDNCFPALIEWLTDDHPATGLPPSGCRLDHLIVSHPEAQRLSARLAGSLDDPRLSFETGPAGLRADISTPHGARVLS